MTRILVCGASIFDDASFVHNALCEVFKTYGPVTCVIHNNHTQALAWQQWASRKHPVKHLPVTEDYRRDGVAAGERCRDRMFEAKPDYVVVFSTIPDKNDIASPATSERTLEGRVHSPPCARPRPPGDHLHLRSGAGEDAQGGGEG